MSASSSSSSLSVSEDSVQRERNCEHQLVVFKLGDEEFGVDIMQVREIIKKENITVVPNAPDFVRGVINLRGQITTIIDLKRKLGISSQDCIDSRQERIIVVETGNNVVGMAVDAVTEVTYLSDKDIEEVPPIIKENMQTKYLRGVGKLPDRLLILIDLKEVLNDNEREIIQ